ncbi:MAG: selenite/tellurite reduction operon c-type cytochrome lipoprotein ExtS [Pelovirga sp.]
MVFRLALLILLCAPVVVTGAADDSLNRCLVCHPVHHASLGSCVDCHRGDPRSSRPNIAHFGLIQARYAWFNLPDSTRVEDGARQLDTYACRRCHVVDQRGNQLASNLDQSVALSAPLPLVEAIRQPVIFMPDFHLPDTLLDRLINALYAAGRRAIIPAGEKPQVVHFEGQTGAADNLFVKHCGSCHRVLTAAQGGLGSSDVAPNLSGLLTPHYPATAADNTAWTRENLQKWLKNPRDIHPLTRMMPVPMEEEELARLLDLLDEEISLSPPAPLPAASSAF